MRLIKLLIAAFLFSLSSLVWATISVNKGFTPDTVIPTEPSILRIQLSNPNFVIASNINLVDNLPAVPAGLLIAPGGLLSNSCGGTVTATPGTNVITLSGGSMPAAVGIVPGVCIIEVFVAGSPASTPTVYTNTILSSNVSSSQGAAAQNTSASLGVIPAQSVTGNKSFTPANLHGNGPASRMRINLNNPNTIALTNVSFTDTFPATLILAAVPNVVSTCGGTVTAAGSGLSVVLAGGTIPASGSCFIEVDIIARNSNTTPANANSTNSIAVNNLNSAQGARNPAVISGVVLVQKAATVAKAFNPTTIQAGATSTLTITINNFNASAISGFNLTDTVPAGVTVVGPATTTCSGGTASFLAGSVTVSGATLPAAPSGSGSSTCTLTTLVTAASGGVYANSIPAGTLAGVSFAVANASLTVTSVSGSKAFSASRPQTSVSTLTITLRNSSTLSAAAITSFSDNLNTMGAGLTIAAAPAATTTCGGTLTATAGTTLISLTGGSIPIAPSSVVQGACTITVPVAIAGNVATGNRTNTIAIGALQTSLGNNVATITANLNVLGAMTISKAFNPTTVGLSGITRLTVTVNKAANAELFTNVSVTDTFPAGFVVAATPNPATTCTGASFSPVAGAGSISLTGASLGVSVAAAASCTFSVDVRASATAGAYTNSIPAGNATATSTTSGTVTAAAATAVITVVNGLTVNKSFNPINIAPGGVSQLTITIANNAAGAVALTNVSLLDTFPIGMLVAPTPTASFTATIGVCSATLNAIAGAGSSGISAGSISAGAICRFRVNVTSTAIGNLINTLPVGLLGSSQGVSNINVGTATLQSSGGADIQVTKTNGVVQLTAGTNTTYTVTISNLSTLEIAAGVPLVDNAPVGMSFSNWTCAASAGSSCSSAAGVGDLNVPVTLLPLGSATFTIVAAVNANATGVSIRNDATANTAAAGIVDPSPGNNTAFDDDPLLRVADLQITKSNSVATLTSGNTTLYLLGISNNGPSDADGALVTDPVIAGLNCSTVTCSVISGSATCPAAPTIAGLNAGLAIPALAVAAVVQLQLTCTVTATGF